MLLCNTCVDNSERDSFIRSRTVSNMEEVKNGKKLKKMEEKMTQVVEKKVVEALKLTQDKVEKTYSSALDAKTQKCSSTVQPLKHPNDRYKFDHKISQSRRVQGVAEDPKKTKAGNLVPTTQNVNEVLKLICEKPNIVELKRIDKIDQKKVKPRILLLTFLSEHETRLVLAKPRKNGKPCLKWAYISFQCYRKTMPSMKI